MVISNDAGATEHISYIVLNEKEYEWNVYALKESLASKNFKKHDIAFTYFFSLTELENIVSEYKPDMILYGTGWQVDFSSVIKAICIKHNIKSIALVDHWARYRERFSENYLPDAILVMDDIANKIANDEFKSEVAIVQTKNYYMEDMMSRFSLVNDKVRDSIVFISQPTVMDKNDLDAYEYTLLEDILNMFDNVIIRLHPTESRDKYDFMIFQFPKAKVLVVEPYQEDLTSTLSKSKLTIGIGSVALYVSYLLGINTISYISNRHKIPSIPLPNEYILTNLKDLKNVDFKPREQRDLYTKAIAFKNILELLLKKY